MTSGTFKEQNKQPGCGINTPVCVCGRATQEGITPGNLIVEQEEVLLLFQSYGELSVPLVNFSLCVFSPKTLVLVTI